MTRNTGKGTKKIWKLSSGLLNPLDSPSPPNSTKIQGNEKSTDMGICMKKIHGAERPLAWKNVQLRGNMRKGS